MSEPEGLQVPLHFEPEFRGSRMNLREIRGDEWIRRPIPFRPYAYAKDLPESAVAAMGNAEGVVRTKKRLLSTLKEVDLWRMEFDTTMPVDVLNHSPDSALMVESHVRFRDRIAIDRPDFYRRFPYGKEPRPLILDTERPTKNGRQIGTTNWIGMKTAEGERIWIEKDDRQSFFSILAKHDLIVGYNIEGYDWPLLGRIYGEEALPTTKLIYDVAGSAFADQTLSGIKSRGLKNVAKWHGFKVVEIDGRNTANYSEAELMEYNHSDLDATEGLFGIYFPRLRAMAEYLGLPLSTVIEGERHTSIISEIVCGRGLFLKGIVSDGTNLERYPTFGKAQGAHVSLEQGGAFENILKIDFSRMYVSILLVLNLGPDTTQLVGTQPIGDLQFTRVERLATQALYYVPDTNLGVTAVISVDLTERGIVADYLADLGARRGAIKESLKGLTEGEIAHHPLHAQENGYKVLGNAMYGAQLQKGARFTNLAAGIVVTGIGRDLIRGLCKGISDHYGSSVVIEIDTDGVYCATRSARGPSLPDPDELEEFANDYLAHWTVQNLGSEGFNLGYSFFPKGYFYKAKNYVLIDEKGKLIIHGSGLKGTHHPALEDEILEEIIPLLLDGKPVPFKEYYDWSRWPTEKFLMRMGVRTELQDYEVEAVGKQIMLQYLRRGESVAMGSILEYYRAPWGFCAFFAEDKIQIDYKYYEKRLNRLLARFGLGPDRPRSTTPLEDSVRKVAEKETAAVMRGLYETCPRCKGMGWVLPKGKILPEECGCENGRRLVVS